jgi:release factor glutamine methyltransferase
MSAAAGERRQWRVLDLLRWTTDYFASRGIASARLDAEVLLAFALGSDRLRLYLDFEKPVEAAERGRFRELVRRRAEERVPVALLTGHREFWSLPLRVNGDVLVPRPETETLVEAALALLPDPEAEVSVMDLGTGSGAVALALARERPKARITATDISEAALAVARSNAASLGLDERLCWLAGDAFAPVAGRTFDLVVSNPPYVGEDEKPSLPPELAHEPREALFAGPDGTALLRRIAGEAPRFLSAGAGLAVELAPQQAPDVAEWLRQAGFEKVSTRRDLGGRPRVVTGRWPGGRD